MDTIHILLDYDEEAGDPYTFVERNEERDPLLGMSIQISPHLFERLDRPDAIDVAVTRAL